MEWSVQRWVVCGGAVLASEEASRILYPSPSPGPFAPTPAPPPLLQESFPDLTTLSARPQVSSCQAGLSASASLWVLGVGPSSQSQGICLLPPWVMVWIPLMEPFQRGHQTGFHGVVGNEGPGLWGSCLWLRDARQVGFLALLCTETEGSGHRRRAQPSIPGLGEERRG